VGVTAFAAAVTHGTANGIAAAILMVRLLRDILAGHVRPGNLRAWAMQLASRPEHFGLTEVGEWLDGYEVDLVKGFEFLADLLALAAQRLPELTEDPWALDSDPSLHLGNGGWRAPHTLVIALLAADMLPGDPWGALRRAVTTDGDSDTIGAVAGAILGAAYPQVFTNAWGELGKRFEARYIAEIAAADEYPFEHALSVR
jgi:ADP-ribosylglycohydrolase